MIRRPPRSTRTDTLFPYTTLFRSIELVAREVHSVATSQTVIPDKRAQRARSGIHGWAERASQYLGCRPGTCCRDPWIVSIEQSRKSADKSFGAYANGSRGQAPGRHRCMKPLRPLPFRQRKIGRAHV